MNLTLISVNVRASAKRETIEKVSGAKFKISVREKTERNLANKRVAELLALYFRVPPKQVRIVKGRRSPSKLFSIGR